MLSLFWTLAAYVAGHVVANISSYVLEKRVVRAVLGSPEVTLFDNRPSGKWVRLFGGFFEPLPQGTRDRLLQKANEKAGINTPGRALFFHCLPIVRRDQIVLDRLNAFLNLYGFSRNVSMAALLIVPMLIVGALTADDTGDVAPRLWAASGALVTAVAMFYRYLKFFRLYTVEVFVNYAEAE